MVVSLTTVAEITIDLRETVDLCEKINGTSCSYLYVYMCVSHIGGWQ